MKRVLYAVMVSLSVLLSSCAYVQTHKNVEEIGSYFEGEVLSTENMGLYKKDSQWYLSATKARFKMRYPSVHDSIFRRNDYSPEYVALPSGDQRVVYHPISAYAAQILQRRDGYFRLRALGEEIQRHGGAWVEELPGAVRTPIAAEIGGKQSYSIIRRRVPEKKRLWSRALGKADLVLVDLPATVVYNVAIPIMAPFVFFYEFAHED